MDYTDGKTAFHRSVRKKIIFAILTVIMLAIILAAWLGPNRILSGFQADFGTATDPGTVDADLNLSPDPVDEKQEAGGNDENRVRIDLGVGYIEIIGYTEMSDSSCLAISLEQVPGFRLFPGFEEDDGSGEVIKLLDEKLKQIYLVDQEGLEYRYTGGNYVSEHFSASGCATGAAWSSLALLEISFFSEEAENLTLVVPLADGEEVTKSIDRAYLESVGECRLPGVTIAW